jgi:hypothetical protein
MDMMDNGRAVRMPTTLNSKLRYGSMIKVETETARIPIKKTAHVVLTMGQGRSNMIYPSV